MTPEMNTVGLGGLKEKKRGLFVQIIEKVKMKSTSHMQCKKTQNQKTKNRHFWQ